MQGLHDAVQLIVQILSNPAWSGISSICSLIGIPLAIHLARKSKTTPPTLNRIPHLIKKNSQFMCKLLCAVNLIKWWRLADPSTEM